MATMQEIEKLMERLGAARDALASAAIAQDEAVAQIQKEHGVLIRAATRRYQAASEAALKAVTEAPELFQSPRSVVLHGIKAGWAKGKGAIDWDDDAAVVAKIERLFPDQADELIRTKKTPIKTALNDLSAHDLRRLGIDVEDAGEAAYVRLAEKEAGKLIRALLRKAEKNGEAE